MKHFDLNFWLCPILGIMMIVVVLWRYFFSSRSDALRVVPYSPVVPEPGGSLVQPVYQPQFLKRLQEVVSWTELLMKEAAPGEWNNRTVFRKTNLVIDGVPAFQLKEEGVSWNMDICQADKVLCVLFNALKPRSGVSPATWEEMKQKGKIVAHEINTTVTDGASEAESLGYVDVYDLPPVDTWIYLTVGTKGGNPILYCWVPTPFVAAMQGAIDISCIENYEWADIDLLLPDYKR